jgi:hypothetical protein
LLPSVRHHNALHRTTGIDKRLPDQENYEVECECGCGQKFMRFADDGRARRRISGHYGDLRRKQRVIVMCACGCGTEIETPDKYGRDRSYLPGHNRETHFHAGRDDRRGCRWRGGRRVDLNPNKE